MPFLLKSEASIAAILKGRVPSEFSLMKNGFNVTFRFVVLLVVVSLSLALHLRAVDRLPIDYDEDDYLRAG